MKKEIVEIIKKHYVGYWDAKEDPERVAYPESYIWDMIAEEIEQYIIEKGEKLNNN